MEAGRQPVQAVLELAFGPGRLGERLGTGRNPSSPALGQFVPLGWSAGWAPVCWRLLGRAWSAVDLAARESVDTIRSRFPHRNTHSVGWPGEASRL